MINATNYFHSNPSCLSIKSKLKMCFQRQNMLLACYGGIHRWVGMHMRETNSFTSLLFFISLFFAHSTTSKLYFSYTHFFFIGRTPSNFVGECEREKNCEVVLNTALNLKPPRCKISMARKGASECCKSTADCKNSSEFYNRKVYMWVLSRSRSILLAFKY